MRPITGDCSCGRFFLHPKRGALRIYCDDCSVERHKARCRKWDAANEDKKKTAAADWYAANRKANAKWRAVNKKRAKAWRAANRDHIRAYNEARA